jgi:hypothetical protein
MIVALLVAALGVAGYLIFKPQSGAERVKAMIAWDPSCDDVVVTDKDWTWPSAAEHATVTCEMAGPLVEYARFDSAAELRRDLLAQPPSSAVCIAGLEVTLDYLEPGQFEQLCRELKGRRIDATRGIPQPAWLSEADEPKFDAWIRALARAQQQALRRYWHL